MISTSTFYSLSGERYVLNITGTNVISRTLVLDANEPVIISYSKPQVKFSGLRTVTCKIKIIANENMSDLCASTATENKVEILHTVNGSQVPIFSGYIIPFQYNTPYTLNNDVIEIEAIDLISACKYKYWTWTEVQTALSSLGFLSQICYPLGITKIIKNDNFGVKSNSAAICDNLTDTTISTQAFLPENFTDDPDIPLPEVISSIAQFFGYVALNLGDTLYLFDPHCLINGYRNQKFNASVYTLTSGTTYTVSRTWGLNSVLYNPVTIAAEDFCNTDTTYSVEQPYGKIKVNIKDTGKYMILPDLLKNTKDYPDAKVSYDTTTETEKTRRIITLQKIDFGDFYIYDDEENVLIDKSKTDTQIANAYINIFNNPNNYGIHGGFVVKMQEFKQNSSNGSHTYTEKKGMLFFDGEGVTKEAIVLLPKCYGFIIPNMKFSVKGYANSSLGNLYWMLDTSNYFEGAIKAPMCIALHYDLYFMVYKENLQGQPTWFYQQSYNINDLLDISPVKFGYTNETALRKNQSTFDSIIDMIDVDSWKDTAPSDADGVTEIKFIGRGYLSSANPKKTFLLTDFEIFARGKSIDDKEDEMKITLDESNNEDLSVDVGMLFRSDTNLKRVLISDTLKGNYCSLEYDATSPTPFTGVLMTQLAARYSAKREAFEMSVSCDVKPWSVVTFDGKNFTVDAMEWNLANDEKRILIN